MACISCGAGLHFECKSGQPCCCANSPPTDELIEDEPRDSRRWSNDRSLRDQQSTGRKRAAVLYPLNPESPCEWQGLKFAGGGHVPIIGCLTGRQQARHHGPDKNTLNNEQGNVHRICYVCHNRWHARNDNGYDPEKGFGRNHDLLTKATPEEIGKNEIYWSSKKLRKVKD